MVLINCQADLHDVTSRVLEIRVAIKAAYISGEALLALGHFFKKHTLLGVKRQRLLSCMYLLKFNSGNCKATLVIWVLPGPQLTIGLTS